MTPCPIYMDVGGHLARLAAKQHQVIFGRRGSGKSCLLVHYHRLVSRKAEPAALSIYIEADEVKTLPYPDLLIRLLLKIGEGIIGESRRGVLFWRKGPASLRSETRALRTLLDEAETARISREVTRRTESQIGAGVKQGAELTASIGAEEGLREVAEFTSSKVETLERHLSDYKAALKNAIAELGVTHCSII